MERLFQLVGFTALPFWALMIFLPRWTRTERVVRSPAIVAAPVLLYAVLVLPALTTILPVVARPALGPVAALLGDPLGATAAWAHFLAFDLFVGRFIYLDARERQLSAWLVSPILLLTLLLGPLGLGLYLLVRGGVPALLRGAAVRAREFIAAAGAGSRPLVRMAAASTLLLAFALVMQLFDPRQVLGASTWLKPAKFAASIALATLTLAWMVGHIGPAARGVRRASLVIVGAATLELVIITLQAARGVPSHFNNRTPLDNALFQLMGAGITVFWFAQLYLAVRAFRTRFAQPLLGWGVRLGLVAALLGGAQGFVMTAPSGQQIAQLKAGQRAPLLGGHSVGSEDGGPGLPVTRWSTTGGDLRVPHFLGLHALQVLPLFAAGLAAEARRRRQRGAGGPAEAHSTTAVRILFAGSSAYVGLMVATLLQALRGHPLATLDLGALGAGLAVFALGTLGGMIATRRPRALTGAWLSPEIASRFQ